MNRFYYLIFLTSISTCYSLAYADKNQYSNEIAEVYDEEKGYYTLDDEEDNPVEETYDPSNESDVISLFEEKLKPREQPPHEVSP